MGEQVIAMKQPHKVGPINSDLLLNTITAALLAINEDNLVVYANTAAE